MRYFDSGHDRKNGSERETGFEPATLCLGSRCSTPELLPRECCNGYWCGDTLVSILPNDYSKRAWEASTLPLSYTRKGERSHEFVTDPLKKFTTSRSAGTSSRTTILYHIMPRTSLRRKPSRRGSTHAATQTCSLTKSQTRL